MYFYVTFLWVVVWSIKSILVTGKKHENRYISKISSFTQYICIRSKLNVNANFSALDKLGFINYISVYLTIQFVILITFWGTQLIRCQVCEDREAHNELTVYCKWKTDMYRRCIFRSIISCTHKRNWTAKTSYASTIFVGVH